MRFDRQIQSLLRRAEILVAERERAAQGGVVALPHPEYEQARAEWPAGEPGDIGKLLVPRALTTDEWIARHSPGPPIPEPKEVPS